MKLVITNYTTDTVQIDWEVGPEIKGLIVKLPRDITLTEIVNLVSRDVSEVLERNDVAS